MKQKLTLLMLLTFAAALVVSCTSGSAEGAAPGKRAARDPNAHLFEWTGDENYRSPRHEDVHPDNFKNQLAGLSDDWWADASFYHVWVKSFYDYDGDGVGDFRGITAKLDYIKNDLGCDAIWLSPIFDAAGKGTAPGYNMHGYDTVNYYDVNDYFGNREHLDTLLREAHRRGIKVIFDYVPNHTSNRHPWFINSAERRDNKDTWYLWSFEKLPWNPMGGTNTWHLDHPRQMQYYGAFWSGMPDLNFRNHEVREEMKNVVRYWLNRGFDGVRVDAVRYLWEDAGPGGQADRPGTFDWFNELRTEVIDAYAEHGYPKFMVGEAWIGGNRPLLESYFGTEEKPVFNMLFDFDFSSQVSGATRMRSQMLFNWRNEPGKWGVFLSNHDNLANRPATNLTNPQDLKLATALSLLQPAVPFVYYANEIGQRDQPGATGDIRLRYPLQWEEVDRQKKDPQSLLNLHRALLRARSAHSALRRGSYTKLPSIPGANDVVSWLMVHENSTILCVANLGTSESGALSIELPVTANNASLVIGPGTVRLSDNAVQLEPLPSKAFRVISLGTNRAENFYPW